jgi:DNA helicase-2/ATP-dependent DNA helicase PcrA
MNTLRFDKRLKAQGASGPLPFFSHFRSARDEAQRIASRVKALLDGGHPPGGIAVLVRAHHQTRALEHAFVKGKLPYRILCGTEFYHRREVKDAICWLRMLSSADDVAFLRVVNQPPRRVGRKTIERITRRAAEGGSSLYSAARELSGSDPSVSARLGPFVETVEWLRARRHELALPDLFQAALDRSGYEAWLRLCGDSDRLDNLAELKRGVQEFASDPESTLEDFLQESALFTDLDRGKGPDSVSVMTIHTAKGLEFDSVFIPGLSEGVFPSRRVDSPEEMEEERRLCYVAMTRARRRLFLSSSEGLAHDGMHQTPSRFLHEVIGCIQGETERDLEALKGPKGRGSRTASALEARFREGDRVEHPSFGKGEVLEVDLKEGEYVVKFDALKTERSFTFAADFKPAGKP